MRSLLVLAPAAARAVAWALTLVALLAGLAACATPGPTAETPTPGAGPTAEAPEQIPMTVEKPEGVGPFPAVVILHDCSGLGPRSSGAPKRWARQLVDHGYVVVLPDSFGSRGYPAGVCTVAVASRQRDVSPDRRVDDAHAAFAHLRRLPSVDPRRIGVMGGSHGGTTTLIAMTRPSPPGGSGFAAGVALYPRCAATRGARAAYRPVAPVLILIGDKDDWTPAEPCRKLTEVAQRAGYPVAIKIYPGAHHSFDSPNPSRYVAERINPSAPGGRGATTAGQPEAWDDSIRQVLAFFGGHLR